MDKMVARTRDHSFGVVRGGSDDPPTAGALAMKKAVNRIVSWACRWSTFRTVTIVAVAGLVADQLAYNAAWKTAERTLRPQQTVSAGDAMETWFAASLAEAKRKRESQHELPRTEVQTVSRR